MENLIFCIHFKKGDFSLERGAVTPSAVQSHPVYPLSHANDISTNYTPLSNPHYNHHTKYIQKVDKPMIYVLIRGEGGIRELLR